MWSTFSIYQDSEIDGDHNNDDPNPAEDSGDDGVANGPPALGPGEENGGRECFQYLPLLILSFLTPLLFHFGPQFVIRLLFVARFRLSADLSAVFPLCCHR